MTIPRSRTFNNRKGFQAQADVGINSPQQSNNQSVNVIVRGIPFEKQTTEKPRLDSTEARQLTQISLTKDNRFEGILNQADTEHRELDMGERDVDTNILSAKPLNDPVETPEFCGAKLPLAIAKERSVETSQNNLAEMAALLTPAGEQRVEEIVKNKDNLIEALSLILDIYENNPLIINKFIVAQEDELTRLLFLLTGAEQIELNKTDPETGCTCKASKFTHINKIMVKKGGNTYNFKYSFPNVVQLLDNRRISWKIVC